MKFHGHQFELGHLLVTYFDTCFVTRSVQGRADYQAGLRGCAGNQVDDGLPAHQRFPTPVLRDEAEQAMLNLVPFARARRKMAHEQFQLHLIRQLLQSDLPQARPETVAAASVRRDQQFVSTRKPPAAHALPPTANGPRREMSRVVMNPDTHPPLVVDHVVNTIGNGFTQLRVFEVMNPDFLRLPLGPPLLPRILEIAKQFLLFRVHRYHRLAAFLQAFRLAV
jgi:hypothetical protein